MRLSLLALSAAVLCPATIALADGHAPFIYAQFEASVPHFDLEECPPTVAEGAGFCRVVFNNDAVHIFKFSEEGEQPLLSFHTFEEEEYTLTLK